MKKNKGFTLIELLVVIAIIGILSSVVLTSLSSAKKRANVAAFRSAGSAWQAALTAECSKATPVFTGAFTSGAAISNGAVSTTATCSNSFPSGGAVTLTAAYGTCVGTAGETGMTFAGADC